MKQNNLLLHICCATCLCYVYELLSDSYNITAYYYNPNIYPKPEYKKRMKDVERYCSMKGMSLQRGEYDISRWTDLIKQFRFFGERSIRCWKCYEFRLEEAFKVAKRRNIDIVTTTLTISPHKDAEKINSIGRQLSQKYEIEFMEADFKKKDGFKKTSKLSSEYGFYKQDYCGCVYSKLEKKKNQNNE